MPYISMYYGFFKPHLLHGYPNDIVMRRKRRPGCQSRIRGIECLAKTRAADSF
jgi:hypothetical protein